MSGSHGTTAPAWLSAVCGSFRPWPVSTQTTRSAPSTPWASRPGDGRGARRLAEHALVGGQEAVGVEDLLVGDRGDVAARGGEGLHRLLPARGVADPDRARDRLRVRDPLAGDERRGALGLEAEQPRRRPHLLEALVVGGHVAGVADGDAERVELAERVEHLEGRGLLALQAERVDASSRARSGGAGRARARAPAPRRSCRAGRSRARRASAPGRACRWRSCPRARSPRRAGRRGRRRRPRSPRCCRSRRR